MTPRPNPNLLFAIGGVSLAVFLVLAAPALVDLPCFLQGLLIGVCLIGMALGLWGAWLKWASGETGSPPKITFGEVDVPIAKQRLYVEDGHVFYGNGIIVRLKVSNAEGCADADGIHATLTFETRDGTPIHTEVEGQWENERGVEITLPGTGREAALDLFAIYEAAGGVNYIWNRHSIAAGLRPSGSYQIDEAEFWVNVLVRGKGNVRAQERIWVFCVGDKALAGKASEESPIWEQLEGADEHAEPQAPTDPPSHPEQLVQQELVAIINEGQQIAGDLLTGDPGWDEITYWTQSSADYLGAVLGPAVCDRLVRVDTASTIRQLLLDRIQAIRGILDRLEPSQIQVNEDELKEARERRRAAPTDFADWYRDAPSADDALSPIGKIDALIEEGMDLLDELGKPLEPPYEVELGGGERRRRAGAYQERARECVRNECPWLLPDFADTANAYAKPEQEEWARRDEQGPLTHEEFLHRQLRPAELRVESVLNGLAAVRKGLGRA